MQPTARSSVLGPAIICSRATHVPPVLHLLFFARAARSPFALHPISSWFCCSPCKHFTPEPNSMGVQHKYRCSREHQRGSNVHHIFLWARTSSFLRCRFVYGWTTYNNWLTLLQYGAKLNVRSRSSTALVIARGCLYAKVC